MSEKDEIKRDGATPVKNSGRSKGTNKGDAVLGEFLVDYKEYSKSFSINAKFWSKICTDAIHNGKRSPALKLVMGEDGSPKTRLWVVEEWVLHEYIRLAKKEQDEESM